MVQIAENNCETNYFAKSGLLVGIFKGLLLYEAPKALRTKFIDILRNLNEYYPQIEDYLNKFLAANNLSIEGNFQVLDSKDIAKLFEKDTITPICVYTLSSWEKMREGFNFELETILKNCEDKSKVGNHKPDLSYTRLNYLEKEIVIEEVGLRLFISYQDRLPKLFDRIQVIEKVLVRCESLMDHYSSALINKKLESDQKLQSEFLVLLNFLLLYLHQINIKKKFNSIQNLKQQIFQTSLKSNFYNYLVFCDEEGFLLSQLGALAISKARLLSTQTMALLSSDDISFEFITSKMKQAFSSQVYSTINLKIGFSAGHPINDKEKVEDMFKIIRLIALTQVFAKIPSLMKLIEEIAVERACELLTQENILPLIKYTFQCFISVLINQNKISENLHSLIKSRLNLMYMEVLSINIQTMKEVKICKM